MKYGLNDAELGYIYNKLRMSPVQENAISKAANDVYMFLNTWAQERGGLDIAGILASGSFFRQTKKKDSDCDIFAFQLARA